MKIAVIMPSYLGDYPGAAKNRPEKLTRAIQSFLDQEYEEKCLLVVADGCEETISQLYKFSIFDHINPVLIPKQELFSGEVRMTGIKKAKELYRPDVIAYLDSDDIFLPCHLQNIADAFTPSVDWIYFNDTLMEDKTIRNTRIKYGNIGTSNIAHRATVPIRWGDGYGHDFAAIGSMKDYPHLKADFATYGVCHIKNAFDI